MRDQTAMRLGCTTSRIAFWWRGVVEIARMRDQNGCVGQEGQSALNAAVRTDRDTTDPR